MKRLNQEKRNKLHLYLSRAAFLLCLCGIVFCTLPARAQENTEEPAQASASDIEELPEEKETIVVVIDPGHGGENLGAEYEDYTEKEMTLIVAQAMKEELEKYEGVTVYLTRTGDEDLTLDERCEYAKSVNADFLFCLHFNMSKYHTLFGAECWVSAFGEAYSKGLSFASIEMEMLQELGLYSRGIKTRLNDEGIDYYGIIRHSVEREMPCVLIEHCHLDQENDKPFYDHDEKLKEFGRLDATAVAKYFNLRSEILGKDYSNYQNVSVDVPGNVVKPDSTEPDLCVLELVGQDMETGKVTLRVSAADYDSGMLYYAYSYDNGANYTQLLRWPDKSLDTFEVTIQIPSGVRPQITVNAYNGYDLYTTSNMLELPTMTYGEEEEEENTDADSLEGPKDSEAVPSTSDSVVNSKTHRDVSDESEEEHSAANFSYFMKVCIVCVLIFLGMIFSLLMIINGQKTKKRKRRKRRRKPK